MLFTILQLNTKCNLDFDYIILILDRRDIRRPSYRIVLFHLNRFSGFIFEIAYVKNERFKFCIRFSIHNNIRSIASSNNKPKELKHKIYREHRTDNDNLNLECIALEEKK